ncbi:MAG: hypothetical protein HYR76_08825 [Ignavibacteria bacterium]|nr:hypothetical protein [Ignavibacteria bacterium]
MNQRKLLLGWFVVVGWGVSTLFAQSPATKGQHVFIMKMLKPGLKTVGVMGSNLTDKDLQEITRLGLAQGVEMVFVRTNESREISMLYKKMVSEKKVGMIWIPDAHDKIMLETAFEFLRENTLLDNIGLCVPDVHLIQAGALCSVQKEVDKIVVHLNKKVAGVLKVKIPEDPSPLITYVLQ